VNTPFCAQLARANTNSMAGTATEAPCWLLIEDPSPWARKAVEGAAWYSEIADAVQQWHAEVPDLRIQLIRRALTTWDRRGTIRCFVVRAGIDPVVHARHVSDYADVAALDVPKLLQRGPSMLPEAPLVLTCTNGRRDACCAKWGRPVAEAARQAHPEGAWQTSHLGGHRFAPTALVLPSGMHYGWLDAEAVPTVVAAHQERTVYALPHCRGRVTQKRPVQAACVALRKRLDCTALDDGTGEIVAHPHGSVWQVAVQMQGHTHRAQVQAQPGPVFRHSCRSDTPKPSTVWEVAWEDESQRIDSRA
jgi:hypothetical protein